MTLVQIQGHQINKGWKGGEHVDIPEGILSGLSGWCSLPSLGISHTSYGSTASIGTTLGAWSNGPLATFFKYFQAATLASGSSVGSPDSLRWTHYNL